MAEAEGQFRQALSRPPYDAYAYNNLGALFAKSGRLVEAESAFREALRRMPDLVEARDNLDRLRRLQERSERAEDLVTTGVR
jgi:Flp pilus assembly protein TadD